MQSNNKWIKWGIVGLAVLALVGILVFFGNYFSQNNYSNSKDSVNTKSNDKSGVQVTGKGSNSNYKTVIKDGHYLTNKARGVTASKNNNQFNMISFENGLQEFSKDRFSPSDYVFQEGQYLDANTAENWLGRKSKSNPDGLNPKDNGKTDSSRNPIYLQTIEEQDYMKQDDNKLKLAGVVIGLGMNTQDTYQKEKYGANYTQDISEADRKAQGQQIAKEVVERYRKMKGISKNVPIVVATYAQAPDDSLAGGNFYSWTKSTNGDQLSGWKQLNNKTVTLPIQGEDQSNTTKKSPAADLNQSFTNFTNNVQNFFPNLSTVTGQATYKDNEVQSLNVTISTQFFSATEITSFANYVAQVAPNYLPKGIPVKINISASNNMQAYVTKNANDDKYTTTILGTDN
ncbi:protein involved in sex pheromone biosynthesis [Weissella uvarum]|uniref:CamS family sex pheromone protein n=1 Tax=Weissella uvarum TaxID=1479233 RepID=UPI001960D43A|nr:CamS family sex pheromone protein [Weissella uvarum]MBM7617449.1 protein involved in sex pheromone biosynthesis [Weissella uvarum]MCM0595666.1 CamS family sex pheromone protein [Weissella uvarum]